MLNKINNVLDRHQKKQFLILVFLMVIGGILEMLSISLLIPYMSFLTNADSISDIPLVQQLFLRFHIESSTDFFVALTILLILAFFVKNLYLYVLSVLQSYYSNRNRHKVSMRLMQTFLRQPYEYYLCNSSNKIEAVILSYVGQAFYLIEILLKLLTELIALAFLVLFMLCLDWRITLGLLFILFAITLLMILCISPKSAALGKETTKLYVEMMKCIRQSTEGIIEVKILKRGKYFLNEYKKAGEKNLDTDFRISLFADLPMRLIEAICIIGILIIILHLLLQGEDMSDLFTTVSVMAITLVRLMPTTYRINSYINIINTKKAALDGIDQELQDYIHSKEDAVILDNPDHASMEVPFWRALSVKDVSYSYPSTDRDVVSHVSMEIPKGSAVALIGSSGNGKTTLIHLCIGLLTPTSGEVTVDEIPIAELLNHDQYVPLIGYIPQTIYLLDDTIESNVRFGRTVYSEEDIWNALEKASLKEFVEQLPDGLNTCVGEKGVRLSGGQRQRIGIARALLGNPEILVLDEATSSLDTETEESIMESIYQLKSDMTLLISTHRLSTIKNCDVVYEVNEGKLIRREKFHE